ncbi:MAG: hypothetical protein M3161_07905, partial [Actinomycetota bacterium]|nr:hypothetical protein [Actinomycetota bacterium]
MRGNGMRRIGAALAVALVAGAFVVVTPGAASACGRALTRDAVFKDLRNGNDPGSATQTRSSGVETVTLRTFHLEVDTPKAGKIGSVAVIKVNITRPAKEDPLGQGIPMDRPYT